MKVKKLIYLLSGMPLMMQSCLGFISDPQSQECDILSVSLHVDQPEDIFTQAGDTLQTSPIDRTNNEFKFVAKTYATVGSYAVTLTAVPKTTVYLIKDGIKTPFTNGTVLDFSGEQKHTFYTVSEDGEWNRTYELFMVNKAPSPGTIKMNICESEDGQPTYRLNNNNKYYCFPVTGAYAASGLWSDNTACDNLPTWANGNPGFNISKSSAKPDEYPTVPAVGEGPNGETVIKLETKETGSFGKMVNMCIAAGSLFNGNFDVGNALKDALKATIFGNRYNFKPTKFTVWLKWYCGEQYIDGSNKKMPAIDGVVDEPDAYVVVYRNQDENGNSIVLDGNDVLSSPYIMGKARLSHNYNADGSDKECEHPIHGLNSSWEKVELPIEYTQELDPEILANYGYSLIIGFSSSWQGAYFRGAVGSRLYVGDILIECED